MPFARKDFLAWALLGEGGEARVFRARQKSTRRLVAIREMKPDAAMRAAHEAELLASLRHQGLAVLIDYGFDQGRFHLVQDYVQGVMPLEFGPLPALAAVRCLRHLGKTLAFLHSKDIIHGDLNPGNLLLTSAEECVLVDFGMVHRLGESSQVAMGTPRYFSPEHFHGLPYTPATDIFACGSLLYFLVTGKHLFPEADFSAVTQTIEGLREASIQKAVATRWAELPSALWPVMEGCLRYNPEDRFEDMDELDENLEIAERQLRNLSGSFELPHTTDAIRKACLSKERQVLEVAYEKAAAKRDWRIAEILLDDMLAIAPADEKLHTLLRFLVQKKRRKRRGSFLLGLGALLFVCGVVLYLYIRSTSEEESMQHFAQEILQQERTVQVPELRSLSSTSRRLRVVRVENAKDYGQVWVDSLPTALTDEFLKLAPGEHLFQGILLGETQMRNARIHVPPEGEILWKWINLDSQKGKQSK